VDVLRNIERQRRRARLVVWLLWSVAALSLASIASGVAQLSLLDRAASVGITNAEASANDLRHTVIAAVSLLAFLATAVAWLFWIHRAYANVAEFGTGKTNHSPGWAVGYWFVPILSLVRPYQITKETWVRSRDAGAGPSGGGTAVVGWWWLLWVVDQVFTNVTSRLGNEAKSIAALQGVTITGMIGDALTVGAALLALAVVRRIDGYQRSAGLTARAVEALS
jgi:Domain of unknown function (DUF4328)